MDLHIQTIWCQTEQQKSLLFFFFLVDSIFLGSFLCLGRKKKHFFYDLALVFLLQKKKSGRKIRTIKKRDGITTIWIKSSNNINKSTYSISARNHIYPTF